MPMVCRGFSTYKRKTVSPFVRTAVYAEGEYSDSTVDGEAVRRSHAGASGEPDGLDAYEPRAGECAMANTRCG